MTTGVPSVSTEIVPASVPALLGLNSAVKFTDSPGVSIRGVVSPEMLNPVPVTLADLIATLAEPPLVNRSDWLTGLPTLTLPKPTTDGVTLRRLVDPVPFRLPTI